MKSNHPSVLVVPKTGVDCSLALGDIGIFDEKDVEAFGNIPLLHRILPGNHDQPALIKTIPNCIGYSGYIKEMEMFYVGGGFSIDRKYRTFKVDWWPDEELSTQELQELIIQFADVKPRIMVSHECPTIAKAAAITNIDKLGIVSRTEAALQAMFEDWQVDLWVFAHMHSRTEQKFGKTRFIGLNEMKYGPLTEAMFEIRGLHWPERLLKPKNS